MLADFIAVNRDEIITRYSAKVEARSLRIPLDAGTEYAGLVFIDRLLSALRAGPKFDSDVAVHHRGNGDLDEPSILPRLAVYGDICQSITELATEMNAPVNVAECATLDRSVDEATARAVTELVSERCEPPHAAIRDGDEQLHAFQHEVLRLVNTAILSFDALRSGRVGLEGSTGFLLNRSLIELRSLVDRLHSDAD